MTPAVRGWIDRHRVASFLIITYAFTWTVQAVLAASELPASWTLSILVGFGAFGPPVGAAVVVWAADGDLRAWVSQVVQWRIGSRWWAVALCLPLVILGLGSGLFILLGGPIDLEALPFPGIYLFVMAWGIVWGGGQEELGWRGFMLPVLQERYSALTSSLAVGVAWMGWHLPLFLNANLEHASWPLTQQLLWGVTILAGSVLWTWMYNSTGSVLAVAVFHAGINAMGIFHPADRTVLVPGGVPDPWLNLLAEGTAALVILGVAVAVVSWYGPEQLSNDAVSNTAAIGLDRSTD